MNMERTIFRIILGFTLIIAASGWMQAQEYVSTPVEISKERVKINGKVCYSHIVLEKQTLYSISKAYGVSIDDIYSFNPSVKESGLKKNSIIIIPSQDALKADVQVQKAEPKPEKASKEDNVKENQKPATADKAHKTTSNAKEKSTRIHIAKWYEDLDVIAEQYNVTVDDIIKANNLKGRKLAKRQKLVIPYPGEEIAATADNTEDQLTSVIVETAAETPEVPDSSYAVKPKTEVNATILLPLTNADGETNRNNMDFYCGALLAVYDMAENGIDCKLNVYDIMNGSTQFGPENLTGSDVIIGPVSSADLTRLFNVTGNRCYVVSPLDPRAERLIPDNTTMIQIPTPQAVQCQDLINWMEEDFKEGDRAVMITEKGARQTAITTAVKEALDSSSFAYNTFSYSILEGRDVTEALTELMTAEGSNRIVIASESEAFVNDVIRNLNLLIYNNIDIVLYASSKTRSFETIEVENLHKTAMHVSLAYYIDYEDPMVKNFLLKYRALFNTEPNQFAFHGYDVVRYFVDLCSKYGDSWTENMENADSQMLQSTFNIRKLPAGGFINNGVRRIIYENGYSVRKEK